MNQPKGYVDTQYLQTTADLLQGFKLRSYEWMQIQPGHVVLDVGCGPASDTLALAQLVGSDGHVSGVDYDPEMVAEAEYRAMQAGVHGWVSHKQGVTDALPYPSNHFDSSRSERVFQHLINPCQALDEMTRVTKPGGRVVVWDADWGTLTIDTDEVETERKLVRIMTEITVNNGYSGRQLYRMFKQQSLTGLVFEANTMFFDNYSMLRTIVGFDFVEREALAMGKVTQEELNRWHASLERADSKGWFFGSVNGILIAGEKPEM
jgi:ubiquinone/menaquinone biosynthesis C-methylase UbiE